MSGSRKKLETRQELAQRELALVRKRIRREYGPSYFAEKMSGLAAAAKQIAKEEKAMASQPMTDKIQ
jgi:hypothetical protein